MLDAFIIEKIQQERELHERSQEALRIEPSPELDRDRDAAPSKDEAERGIAIIDFTI